MYEGWTRLLIVFLTHPGIVLSVPAEGLWTWVRAIWQAAWVMVLHSLSEGKWSQLASIVYWVVLVIAAYLQVAIAMAK